MDSNDDTFNSLPDEMLVSIFSHLSQNELARIARVCRRWNVLTRRPALWRKVDVKFHWNHASQNTVTRCFVEMVPPCVTHIRLDFGCIDFWSDQLNFEELCVGLKRCPNLEMLILDQAILSCTDSLHKVIEMSISSLWNLKSLVFHRSLFSHSVIIYLAEFGANIGTSASKIEVLGFSRCHFEHLYKLPFFSIPHLKKLCLYFTKIDNVCFKEASFLNQLHLLDLGHTGISSRIFLEILNHGFNLKELYLCATDLNDDDFNFNKSVFPHLKTICVGDCQNVTYMGVVSLIKSCQSLQNVYVKQDMAVFYAAHPFMVANKCKLEIVKIIPNCDDHKRDYLCV